MKECIYGWYPPAKNPYIGKNQKDSYHNECLFRHWNSRLNDRDGVGSPAPPTSTKIHLSPRQPSPHRSASRTSSRVASRASYVSRQGSQLRQTTREDDGGNQQDKPIISVSISPMPRPPSTQATPIKVATPTRVGTPTTQEARLATPIRVATPSKPATPTAISVRGVTPTPGTATGRKSVPSTPAGQRSAPPTPKKAWSMNVPATEVTYKEAPHPPSCTCKSRDAVLHRHVTCSCKSHDDDAEGEGITCKSAPPPTKPERAQSASYSRPRHQVPRRSIKSAGATRSPITSADRPRAPVPPADDADERPDSPLDYDEQLEKHGWRMEVPGDPLNLKRPCFMKRGVYSVEVPIPEVSQVPPKGHMQNYETFFYNTIPRKPLSFTIHEEWISEVLHAKRMELQKREGYKYRTNDFSFIY